MSYLFYIDDGTVITTVHPLNFNAGNIVWQPERDQIFCRRTYSGSLTFQNNDKLSYTDFDYFYNKLTSGSCDNLVLTIYKQCGDDLLEIFTGVTTPRKGQYDVDRCKVVFDFTPSDKYNCILDNWDTAYNVLALPPQTTGIAPDTYDDFFYADFIFDASSNWHMDPLFPPLRIQGQTIFNLSYDQMDIDLNYNFTPNAQTANVGHPWQMTYYDPNTGQNKMYVAGQGGHPEGWQAEYITWKRIGSNIAGALFVQCTVRYVRKKIVTFDINGVPQPPPGTIIHFDNVTVSGLPATEWHLYKYADVFTGWSYYFDGLTYIAEKTQSAPVFTAYYSRGMMDIMKFLTDNTCSDVTNIVSDFFQYNPVTPSPTNYITGLQSRVDFLQMVQMSDFLSPGSAAATFFNLNLKTLLDMCRDFFQVYWDIDDSGNLVLEHWRRFKVTAGTVNLLQTQYERYIRSKNKFQYEQGIPARERLTIGQSVQLDFVGADIVYDAKCTDGSLKEYRVTDINTDTQTTAGIRDGFMLFSCYPAPGGALTDFVVWPETTFLTGQFLNNGHLSCANLFHYYWRANRFLPSGEMNFSATTFNVRKLRKQDAITIPFCCDDVADFDPNFLYVTELGSGEIFTASYSPKTETITLILHYE